MWPLRKRTSWLLLCSLLCPVISFSQMRVVQRSLFFDFIFIAPPSDISLQYELVTPAGFSGLFTPRIGGGIHFSSAEKISAYSGPLITGGISYLPGHSIVKFEAGIQMSYYFISGEENIFSTAAIAGIRYQIFPKGLLVRMYASAAFTTNGKWIPGVGISLGYSVR